MAEVLGRKAKVYVKESTTPTIPTNLVGKSRNFKFPQTPVTADLTSNDSGPRKEHRVAQVEGDLTFEFWYDRSDVGQTELRNATKVDGTGTGMVYVELHPEGTLAGLPKESFYASVEMSRDHSNEGHILVSCTLRPSGAITYATQ